MNLFHRGPPKVPEGSRAVVAMDDPRGGEWSVRLETDGVTGKRISPAFTMQTTAYAYLDWIEGRAERFEYPTGRA